MQYLYYILDIITAVGLLLCIAGVIYQTIKDQNNSKQYSGKYDRKDALLAIFLLICFTNALYQMIMLIVATRDAL